MTSFHASPATACDERPTAHADRAGDSFVSAVPADRRSDQGLYLTPIAVAEMMAAMVEVRGRSLRVLDPAAGSGVLACALVEHLAGLPDRPDRIELVAYEVDSRLAGVLRNVLDHLRGWAAARGVELDVRIVVKDFVLEHAAALRLIGGLLPYQSQDQAFDVVIANPPYFKIPKDDPRAQAALAVVHGQPNIYGLFMAVSTALLRRGGDFVFIVPRSFTAGPYFRLFRQKFFACIRPEAVHVFGSRKEAFRRDEILQENIIIKGVRDDGWADGSFEISSSHGVGDLGARTIRRMRIRDVFDPADHDLVLRLPINDADDAILELVDSWPDSLHRLGLEISTGPVVPFRAREVIDEAGSVPASHVPLLWMQHVTPMRVTWPIDRHKQEYIKTSALKILVPNRNYVLMRRFSAKEELKRLVAAPYLARQFEVPMVGLENHLNYVHRPKGNLSEDETLGLAALYNSSLLDSYFRCSNGNTQVSATELRAMPLPPKETIIVIGREAKRLSRHGGIDALVARMVGAPDQPEREAADGDEAGSARDPSVSRDAAGAVQRDVGSDPAGTVRATSR